MINPWIIGRMPAFFISLKDVLSPMAANALTIRNLLMLFVSETNPAGIVKMLAITDIPTKPKINQGKIFAMLKFALISSPLSDLAHNDMLVLLLLHTENNHDRTEKADHLRDNLRCRHKKTSEIKNDQTAFIIP